MTAEQLLPTRYVFTPPTRAQFAYHLRGLRGQYGAAAARASRSEAIRNGCFPIRWRRADGTWNDAPRGEPATCVEVGDCRDGDTIESTYVAADGRRYASGRVYTIRPTWAGYTAVQLAAPDGRLHSLPLRALVVRR